MNLRDQFDGPDSRTWVWHGCIAVVITALFIAVLRMPEAVHIRVSRLILDLPVRWMLPGLIASFVYWFLELRGWPYSGKRFLAWLGVGRERRDHIVDVVSPTVSSHVAAAVAWFGLGLRW